MSGSKQSEKVIILMGPTGAGKSTFIDCATNRTSHGAGHGLRSCTAEILTTKYDSSNGQRYTFVDTPGFDDTYKSDTEILSMIAEFLMKARQNDTNLHTILYLHRISDNRMAGSPLKNLQLFASLCGGSAMPHVVLVTTMWSHVTRGVGEERVNQLKNEFWQDMIEKGCKIREFDGTYKGAWNIIEPTSKQPINGKPNLLISTEMVDKRRSLKETEAGVTLNKQLKKLIKDQKEANRRLRTLADNQKNAAAKQELTKRLEELDHKIEQTTSLMRDLKIPFMGIIKRLFTSNDTVAVREN